ncbi:hypothetical protein KFZ70_04320 [Tamlana fucoidanivorans]|uniref:T9SS type A sorting domain-containing protein n=1 Tax=Allotamlana fucoidanivorans TaxID=2583814 RepID=A0A5C4SSL4_9FLAO|nr:hypothetical protein [Tamlana fucoidanivorans]TNJ47252.1 hypothetical protein FGF67_01655 [Tamlana fucoidanivorans]
MKKVIKHSKKGFLMVTLFATLLSFANDASKFKITFEAKRTPLTLYNIKKGNVLSIKDENGLLLYKELLQQSGIYSKGFDLTSLPNGTYMFELEKDFEIKLIPFYVKSNTVTFQKKLEETIFKPAFRVEGDMVYMSKLNLNRKPLKINFYFLDGNHSELMYSKTLKNQQLIEKAFKLEGLSLGTYKIEVISADHTFEKHIY